MSMNAALRLKSVMKMHYVRIQMAAISAPANPVINKAATNVKVCDIMSKHV